MEEQRTLALSDIRSAHSRISSLVKKTPLIKTAVMSEQLGINTYLKLETLNEVGSFKIRGAANKMLQLTDKERNCGVTTYSTGNHGLAVAFIARQLGIKAVICISSRVPKSKLAALKQLDATIEIVGEGQDAAAERSHQLQKIEGFTIIPPFDDIDIIAGQGTIALELLEDLPNLEEVVIPLSGGGLLSGLAYTLKQLKPTVNITGVSIEGASAMNESLLAGQPVEIPEKETLADSLLGGINLNNRHTFSIVRTYMDKLVLLSEEEVVHGMEYLLNNERIVAEGAGAAGIAALLAGKREVTPQHPQSTAAVIVSGSNIDWLQFCQAWEVVYK
ncbi:pyridoxal-phosphate dependent enzyme [Sediminibacillus albus]|uniref:threonine ammonia-lyase n=1 Tax=Sediminibacillus albus TaxID=407036 RepID=A0A1G8WQX9_9BACI|nr:pyridoxal-phosphate dependent enzyme [Sediminibacillus albus]SDJ80467.1 threonine dehydratase [Sediminibacillus albus]